MIPGLVLMAVVIWLALTLYLTESAYRNGATDGYGYSREPNNPGYAKAGKCLRETMSHRWRELESEPVDSGVWPSGRRE